MWNIIDTPSPHIGGQLVPSALDGHIQINNVSFSYPSRPKDFILGTRDSRTARSKLVQNSQSISRGNGPVCHQTGQCLCVSLILENVSLDIQPESTCAIVGKSGSGKSTLAKILFNFYPTQGGSITLDGNNWAELDYDWLRSNMAMVPQDPELFADTIRFEPAGPRIPD